MFPRKENRPREKQKTEQIGVSEINMMRQCVNAANSGTADARLQAAGLLSTFISIQIDIRVARKSPVLALTFDCRRGGVSCP